jgi:hypothetical protein
VPWFKPTRRAPAGRRPPEPGTSPGLLRSPPLGGRSWPPPGARPPQYQPVQGHLRGGPASGTGHLLQGTQQGSPPSQLLGEAGAPWPGGKSSGSVLAGEQPHPQGAVGEQDGLQLAARFEKAVALRAAVYEAVGDLDGSQGHTPAAEAVRGPADLVRGEVGDAHVLRQPLLHRVGQRLCPELHRPGREGPVHLVQEDPGDPEALEAPPQGPQEACPGQAPGERHELRGHEDGRLRLPEQPSQQALRVPAPVHLRGVHEPQPAANRGAEGLPQVGFSVAAAEPPHPPVAPLPGAEAEGGQLRISDAHRLDLHGIIVRSGPLRTGGAEGSPARGVRVEDSAAGKLPVGAEQEGEDVPGVALRATPGGNSGGPGATRISRRGTPSQFETSCRRRVNSRTPRRPSGPGVRSSPAGGGGRDWR